MQKVPPLRIALALKSYLVIIVVFFLLSIYLFLFDFQKEHSDTTLRRCIDVEPTLYKRHVPAGNKLIDYNEQCKLN